MNIEYSIFKASFLLIVFCLNLSMTKNVVANIYLPDNSGESSSQSALSENARPKQLKKSQKQSSFPIAEKDIDAALEKLLANLGNSVVVTSDMQNRATSPQGPLF